MPRKPKLLTDHSLTIAVPLQITKQRIASLLVGAFEGGSNYWIKSVDVTEPKGINRVCWLDSDATRDESKQFWPTHDSPLCEGGSVVIDVEWEGGEPSPVKPLNLDTITAGLATMARDEPRHFGDFQSGDDDATTSDVFLQCCVLGKVIFG